MGLCGYGIWWAADLGNSNVMTSAPSSPQRSWKQLVRWLDEPRFVSEGDEAQVLACHNENQFNVEDIFMPREMLDRYQEQMQADCMQKHHEGMSTQAALAAVKATAAENNAGTGLAK